MFWMVTRLKGQDRVGTCLRTSWPNAPVARATARTKMREENKKVTMDLEFAEYYITPSPLGFGDGKFFLTIS